MSYDLEESPLGTFLQIELPLWKSRLGLLLDISPVYWTVGPFNSDSSVLGTTKTKPKDKQGEHEGFIYMKDVLQPRQNAWNEFPLISERTMSLRLLTRLAQSQWSIT
ncbi:3391_t:CDS:2 [Cetraspora pellucida]|uniref:3391_t:CDS:1 n=1 Tax=Cetraspora pellucida TaxID=1433469 RepID=A0A9N9A2I8_9GLOM|nr:3391_t:CDS:2 [Cetraspora pellucida]